MARSFNGSTQFASSTFAAVTTTPVTMACWAKPASFGASTSVLVGLSDTVSALNDAMLLRFNTTGTVNALYEVSASALASATTVATATLGKWCHCCAVFPSANSRTVYLNGGNAVTDNTAVAGSQTLNSTDIAVYLGKLSVTSQFYNGTLAEIGIWNAALTAEEILALSLGILPYRIRPNNLKGYWPLWGIFSPEPDMSIGQHALTLAVSPPFDNHAPVVPFTRISPENPFIFTPATTHLVIAPKVVRGVVIGVGVH